MSELPLIGVTARYGTGQGDAHPDGKVILNRNYLDCLVEAGADVVVLAPSTRAIAMAPILDGWLIPGGDDLDAALWGEPNHPAAGREHPDRVQLEFDLYRAAPEAMPVLGICYGCQFLNVARGGSLQQHLPDVTETVHTGGPLQSYAVADGKLRQAVGTEQPSGKSYHHQAVARLGQNLAVVARHEDGTVEGIEDTGSRWLVGVQWHPERTPDDPATRSLFRTFVEQCASYRRSRRT